MKIIVINLAAATDRLSFQQRQLGRLELAFDRLEGVSAHDIESEVDQAIFGTWQRPMRPGEIACFLSHRAAWQRIVDSQEPTLVLEDDALLSSYVPNVLKALSRWDCADHVTLEVRGRKKLVGRNAIPVTGPISALRIYQDRSGAAAYVLWPGGAEKLLSRTRQRAGLADAVIGDNYELCSYQLEPACAVQLDQCSAYGLAKIIETKSTTVLDKTKRPDPGSIINAAGFRSRRIKAQVCMLTRRLTVIHRAQRRIVKLDTSHFGWTGDAFVSQR